MTALTIGELASTLLAYAVTCEISLERRVWIVRVGEGIAAHEDLDIAIEAATVMMAEMAGKAVA